MRRIKQAFDCEISYIYFFCAFDQAGDGMYSMHVYGFSFTKRTRPQGRRNIDNGGGAYSYIRVHRL